MFEYVAVPLWFVIVSSGLLIWALLSRALIPSVRWYFRRRLEAAVTRLNKTLSTKIQPFKLARRHDMVQRLTYDAEVLDAVTAHAREENVPEDVAFERASRYAKEIVPSFSAAAYFGVGIRGAKWLAKTLYRVRLGYIDETKLSEIDPEATVVFVMNHRSNMDYVLVTYLVAQRSALSYAVGEWARVWPLRTLIRSMGAFFIRRKSRNGLYRKVLARYVQLATKGGVCQAMFPEGGLSLDGKVAKPKLGLLSYITEADTNGRPVVFVPVALSYDRVLEDRVLIAAGKAGNRRFPARIRVVARFVLKQLWNRIRGKFYRFGYASVSFGAPVDLATFDGTTEALGAELMRRIEQVMPVLPVPLVAAALLRANEPMNEADVLQSVETHVDQLQEQGAHIHLPRESTAYAVEVGLRMLRLRHLLDERGGKIAVSQNSHELLEFYANSIPPVEIR